MFRLGTENPWICSTSTDRKTDFCLWVLEQDGLHVPPFEYHAQGDGALRRAGLDVQSWRSWVEGIVRSEDQRLYTFQRQHVQIANDVGREMLTKAGLPADLQAEASRHYFREHGQEFHQLLMQDQLRARQIANDVGREMLTKAGLPADLQAEASLHYLQEHQQELIQLIRQAQQAQQIQPDPFFAQRIDPPEAWGGAPEVGKHLGELWARYKTISEERFAWEHDLHADDGGTNLWQELAPYHTRLDSIVIHLVTYSQELAFSVPPRSIILTIVNGRRDPRDFNFRVLVAAEVLATLQSL